MKAVDLQNAMQEIGFKPKLIQTLPLPDAQQAFIRAVNDLVPEGSEDEPNVSDLVLKVYNTIDTDPVEDWPEIQPVIHEQKPKPKPKFKKRKPWMVEGQKVIYSERMATILPDDSDFTKGQDTLNKIIIQFEDDITKWLVPCSELKLAPKPPKPEPVKNPVGRPKGATKRMAQYRREPNAVPKRVGLAVTYSRLTAVLEALRVGGGRLDVIKRADKLYMLHGGVSNMKQTELAYISALRVLKALKLISTSLYPTTVKLKKFFTADSKEYQQVKKISASSNSE